MKDHFEGPAREDTGPNRYSPYVAYAPDGAAIAACDQDGTIVFWDLESKEMTTIHSSESVRSGPAYLGFSPDGKTLYHSDSLRRSVFCYEVAENGDLGEKTHFAKTETGAPDGLVVSEDGAVWVALAGGGKGVAVYNADGSYREHIEIPHPMCTSVCFGGEDLKDLYIVSGSDDLPGDKAGGIFKVRTDVPGLPVPRASVPLDAV